MGKTHRKKSPDPLAYGGSCERQVPEGSNVWSMLEADGKDPSRYPELASFNPHLDSLSEVTPSDVVNVCDPEWAKDVGNSVAAEQAFLTDPSHYVGGPSDALQMQQESAYMADPRHYVGGPSDALQMQQEEAYMMDVGRPIAAPMRPAPAGGVVSGPAADGGNVAAPRLSATTPHRGCTGRGKGKADTSFDGLSAEADLAALHCVTEDGTEISLLQLAELQSGLMRKDGELRLGSRAKGGLARVNGDHGNLDVLGYDIEASAGTDGATLGASAFVAQGALQAEGDMGSVRAGLGLGVGLAGRVHTGRGELGVGADIGPFSGDVKVNVPVPNRGVVSIPASEAGAYGSALSGHMGAGGGAAMMGGGGSPAEMMY